MIENKVGVPAGDVEQRRYSRRASASQGGGDYGPDVRVWRSRTGPQVLHEPVLLGMRHRWAKTVDNCVGNWGASGLRRRQIRGRHALPIRWA
jgi:hypothetical protein